MKKQSARTKRLIKADKELLWHPFTKMLEWEASTPLVIERATGNYLIDTDGNHYLDAASSLWVTVHGHRKKEIDSAIKAQLGKVAHSTLLGLGGTASIELAERLIAIAPKGLRRVFYSDNGSTAVEIALKMAFHYQQLKNKKKVKFLCFEGAYHGDTVGSMSVGEIDCFVDRYKPLLFDSIRAPFPNCYRCPLKLEESTCKLACLAEVEKIFKANAKELAACIIEPLVQGAAGMQTSPPGFLKGLSRMAKKYDVLLIADEVATGFGRTGKMFACDHENIRPDIMCLAKGITGGYMPLAATITTEKIYKAFLGTRKAPDAFYHGHTYTGNPLGCAAAIASLDLFEREATIDNMQPKIQLLKEELLKLAKLDYVGNVRQKGFMCAVELVADKKTKKPFSVKDKTAAKVCLKARDMGVIIRNINDTIIIMPPLSIKTSEIKKLCKVLSKSIRDITE